MSFTTSQVVFSLMLYSRHTNLVVSAYRSQITLPDIELLHFQTGKHGVLRGLSRHAVLHHTYTLPLCVRVKMNSLSKIIFLMVRKISASVTSCSRLLILVLVVTFHMSHRPLLFPIKAKGSWKRIAEHLIVFLYPTSLLQTTSAFVVFLWGVVVFRLQTSTNVSLILHPIKKSSSKEHIEMYFLIGRFNTIFLREEFNQRRKNIKTKNMLGLSCAKLRANLNLFVLVVLVGQVWFCRFGSVGFVSYVWPV